MIMDFRMDHTQQRERERKKKEGGDLLLRLIEERGQFLAKILNTFLVSIKRVGCI